MKSKLNKFAGFLLGSVLIWALFLSADPVTVSAAETTLQVDANAGYSVVPDRDSGSSYRTIQDALSKALDGDIIQLVSDITPETFTVNAPYKIPAGESLTLDLNGHAITAVDGTSASFYLFENKGNFTVTDTAGNGKISLENSKAASSYTESAAIMNQGGTVTISGGTIQSTGDNWPFAVDNLASKWNSGAASCSITGGSLVSSYNPLRLYTADTGCTCNLTVSGGSLTSQGAFSPIYLQENPSHGNTSIDISGGTFDAAEQTSSPLAIIYWWNNPVEGISSSIDISGGEFGSSLKSILNYWVDNTDTTTADYGTLSISGGTFKAAPVIDAGQLTAPARLSAGSQLKQYVLGNYKNVYETGTDCFIVLGGNPPVIRTESLPDGALGAPYSQTLAADGSQPITWSVTSGTLPDGLTLDSSTGVISGSPALSGKWDFTVTAENSLGQDVQEYTITVSEGAPVTIRYIAENGGTVSSSADENVLPVSGTPAGSTASANSGYRFVSWTDESGRVVSTEAAFLPAKGSSGWTAAVYYANFAQEDSRSSFTLTFDSNGGNRIEPVTEPGDTVISLAGYVPAKAGCTFDGWYSDAALKNKITSVTLSQDTTVYAKWILNTVPAASSTVLSAVPPTGDSGSLIFFIALALFGGVLLGTAVKKEKEDR